MELDTFYVVTIPEHTKKETSFSTKTYGTCLGLAPKEAQVYIPEKKYYFYKRKQSKKFCLEHNYPFEYITKELY